jgi:hypothetical protein
MAKVPLVPSRLALVAVVSVAASLATMRAQTAEKKAEVPPTAAARLGDIKRAAVWTQTDIESMDLRSGPQGKGALPPFASVSCAYVERKIEGTPKFTCALAPGDDVKIKYGVDNAEVYGVVAASRLLWALGFGADRWYPVSVTCHRCPEQPHRDERPSDHDVVFEVAALERQLPGKTIESHADEGWRWSELDLVSEDAGGAPPAERDALKLLAVMLQHTDSKAQQQRLICLDAKQIEDCRSPFMYIHDLGLTFGKATAFNRSGPSGVNFDNWSKAPVWKDRQKCVGNLPESQTGTLSDPVIHEPGRKFLAGLLAQLSDGQLRDLFEVARFPQRSHTSADDWLTAFKAKREQIASVTCGGG